MAVPPTFNGFYSITTPTTKPTLYFVDIGAQAPAQVTLLTPAASDALNQAFPVQPDPDSGSISIAAYDCNGVAAAGIHYDLDARTDRDLPFYAIASTISPRATATDSSGIGGFANLREDTITVTATLERTGQVIATGASLIRSKTITNLHVRPRSKRP